MEQIQARLSAQYSILGAVTPNLRAVFVELDASGKACLHFYYDQSPSDDEVDLAGVADAEFGGNFTEDTDFKISVWPYPKLLPKEGLYIYLRCEPPTQP